MELALVDNNELKLKHPFSMILAGNRRTGKTQFIKRVLLERERFITPAVEHVIWFYAAPQWDVFNELQAAMNDGVEFVRGLPENINDEYLNAKYGGKLIVLDDLMEEASSRSDIKHLFTRGRHENASVVFLTQNLFHKAKHAREMSINSDYVVLFKNPRDASTTTNLGRQMGNAKFLQEAYRDATKEPFSHLFMDLRSDTKDALRYRGNIFSEFPVVYAPSLSGKTYK